MRDNADSVYLDDGDVQFYHGDVVQVLRSLPAGIAQTCVTSPPYWGLRDYGTGSWTGGDADCDHLGPPFRTRSKINENWGDGYSDVKNAAGREPMGEVCSRCGARRVDQQLGLEPTPELYVTRMVGVFREVWRVLRDDGTLWLNIGDSYASGPAGNAPDRPSGFNQKNGRREGGCVGLPRKAFADAGLKPKDLVGIPWRLAFALQADGWYLRSEIIWAKPNPMPESVTDRPTKAHEYLFLLSKQPRYFYDADAIREPGAVEQPYGQLSRQKDVDGTGDGRGGRFDAYRNPEAGRNRRSVWVIPTEPFSASALGGGTTYRASADCPKHGLRAVPESWRRVARGEPQDPSPYRIDSTDARLALELHGESVSNSSRSPAPESSAAPRTRGSRDESRTSDSSTSADSPAVAESSSPHTTHTRLSPVTPADSSGSLRPENGRAATPHSTGSHRTGRDSSTNPPCTPSAETPARIGGTSGSHESGELFDRTPESSISLADSGARPSAQTQRRIADTCSCTRIVHDHFATFPQALVEPCIKAGTSERGGCGVCGAPWRRIVDAKSVERNELNRSDPRYRPSRYSGKYADLKGAGANGHRYHESNTIGWEPSCQCRATICPKCGSGLLDGKHIASYPPCNGQDTDEIPTRPQTVLDPFVGSGTTALVARRLGRRCIGIDLSQEYLEIAARRTQQLSLLGGAS